MRLAACREQLFVLRIDLSRAPEGEGKARRRRSLAARPARVEALDRLDGVEHQPQAARELDLRVTVTFGIRGNVEPEAPVELPRAVEVVDHDPDRVERHRYDATTSAAVRSPSSGAMGRSASITKAMCSSRSIPSSSAPL